MKWYPGDQSSAQLEPAMRGKMCARKVGVFVFCARPLPPLLEECTPLYQFLVMKQRPNQMFFENVTNT